jgi:hypothetical protein
MDSHPPTPHSDLVHARHSLRHFPSQYSPTLPCSRSWYVPSPPLCTSLASISSPLSVLLSTFSFIGTGSGSFSHSALRTIGKHGHLFSFEFHQGREIAARCAVLMPESWISQLILRAPHPGRSFPRMDSVIMSPSPTATFAKTASSQLQMSMRSS